MEKPSLSMVKDSICFVLQSNQTIFDNETKKVERLMVYGNPSLLGTMVGDIQVYIDDTFRIYPSQFYQCLIIMVFDLQLSVYVPVFYVLTTGNTENLYWYALD